MTDGRTDKAVTICSPFGEHKNNILTHTVYSRLMNILDFQQVLVSYLFLEGQQSIFLLKYMILIPVGFLDNRHNFCDFLFCFPAPGLKLLRAQCG